MMLNQLILARGYVLAPMLPPGGASRPVADTGWHLAAKITHAFRRLVKGAAAKAEG